MNTLKDYDLIFSYIKEENHYELYMNGVIIGIVPFIYRISDVSYFRVTVETMEDLVDGLNKGTIDFNFNFEEKYFESSFNSSKGFVISNIELENDFYED